MQTRRKRHRQEAGQASILVVLMLSLFLLAVLAFAVDYTNIWFQRQQAQTAADAACEAGAMDMYQVASGVSLPNMGFGLDTGGNCSAYGANGPTMCWYAGKNGFNGYTGGPATVSWTFLNSVNGVTTQPPVPNVPHPFMQVSVSLPVKTYFSTLLTGNQTQPVGANATCGLMQIMEGAPIMVLNPTVSGALTYKGGASLTIVGGPPRSIVVNSSSSTAVNCVPSGLIDTSRGGPNFTGSDVGTVGGPPQAPNQQTCPGGGFNRGATGHWVWPATPVPDPYSSVPPASGMSSVTPLSKKIGNNYFVPIWLNVDGCPDHQPTNYFGWGPPNYPTSGCKEYAPGYYPNGISESASDVIIFLPGVYYMGGDLNIGGSDTIRIAKPCANSQGVVNPTLYNPSGGGGYCSPLTISAGPNGQGGGGPWTWHQTDGVMFYFHGSAKPNIQGGSGAPGFPRVDKVPATDLTCDGSTPPSYLNLPSALDGNILLAQCTSKGSYYDQAGDTTDSLGNIRGLLMFMDHSDTASPQLNGSGTLAYTGTLYFHSSSYATVFHFTGGTSTGTLVWGNVITDQLLLDGSGALNMALNPAATTPILKVGLMQ